MVLQKLRRVSQNFSQISRVSQSRYSVSGYVRLAVSPFFMKPSRSLDFFKGKEVLVKVPICLFVFTNFDVFS